MTTQSPSNLTDHANPMRKVTVDKEELLAEVKENRQKHKEEYEQAVENYCKEAARRFREKVEAAEAGHPTSTSIDLDKPIEFLDEYDQAIRMLEMEQNDQIELTESEFQKLVLDEWNWSSQFERHTSSYT